MVDVKYPGITDALTIAIQDLAGRPIVVETKDCINSSETMKKVLQNMLAIIKIEVKLFDVVKDLGLSIFNILHHWRWEQVRIIFFFITPPRKSKT